MKWISINLGRYSVAVLICLCFGACGGKKPIKTQGSQGRMTMQDKKEALKKLSPEQLHVTQENGTEPAFRNAYWDNHQEGLYVDIVSGEPLFSSKDKFDSGTGWPSFSKPIEPANVVTKQDASHGMTRVEVRSKNADSHLGHLFDDGPAPTGQRYCMNSASLRFIAVDNLEAEGYGKYLPLFGRKPLAATAGKKQESDTIRLEVATLAGGCFWGMEEILRKIKGVKSTYVGYTGGTVPHATYELVKKGHTGHAEAVRIQFNPSEISYEELLGYFFRMHDPTTLNRQGNDVGDSYRSAIFYHSDAQKKTAEKVRAEVDKSGKWPRPVVTEIVPAKEFWKAEDYHQNYLEKNPGGYTCHFLRD